jgi:hypothetical protein
MISAVSGTVACVPGDAHSWIDSGDESQHGDEDIYAGYDVEVVLVVEEIFYCG